MGLFSSKKNPCAICGGATPRLLYREIEGQRICNNCSGRIEMESCLQDNLTIQSLKEHLAFLDENQALRDSFNISKVFDFGFLGEKVIFDFANKLFCMSGSPNKTVFEGSSLKSFTIKEDLNLLFAGSQQGLQRYTSTVPERVALLAPQIQMFVMKKLLAEKDKDNAPQPRIDIPEPFTRFEVELKLEHPY